MITSKEKEAIYNEVMKMMNKLKTGELTDFEKVCPTEMSFNRVKKDVHDRFDQALDQIKFHI